jgi:hypothetical protein
VRQAPPTSAARRPSLRRATALVHGGKGRRGGLPDLYAPSRPVRDLRGLGRATILDMPGPPTVAEVVDLVVRMEDDAQRRIRDIDANMLALIFGLKARRGRTASFRLETATTRPVATSRFLDLS